MKKEIRLPEIAENVETATVTNVLVTKGDSIEKEQTIVEMESEKAAFDLPAPESGTVQEVRISDGDEVRVGDVLLIVETPTDTSERPETEEREKEAAAEEQPPEEEEEQPVRETEEPRQTPQSKEQPGADQQQEPQEPPPAAEQPPEQPQEEPAPKQRKEVAAAPSVRRLARELGVDIYQVKGSGTTGRILAEDVKAHAKGIVSEKDISGESAAKGAALPDFSQWGDTERKPMSNVRGIIARNMTHAWQTIPHVNQFDQSDVTDLEQFRQQQKRSVEQAGGKLTITAILLKVVAFALQRFPKFNASLDMANQEIIYKDYIHIGVAVDTERGLLVPVIRDVDRKSLTTLAVELTEIAEKAREKKLKPDAMQGGNFSISNLGGIGGTNFTPIVYPPQVAVLGVARASMQLVYHDSEFTSRLILPLSLSYDHRVIDGAEGARFLRWICQALEQPLMLFLEE